MKPGGLTHPKLKRLARALGVSLPAAAGHLEFLIQYTNQYALRGDIGRFTNEEIAEAALWEGDADALILALDGTYFDRHPVHRFVVHDWDDHAPDYTKKKIKNQNLGWAKDDLPGVDTAESIQVKEPQQEDSRQFQKNPAPLSHPNLSKPIPPKPSGAPAVPTLVAGWAQPIFDRVNATLELYQAGRIDACRPGSTREGRWSLIRRKYAGGDVGDAGDLIVKAIHGYVCRNGSVDRDDYDAARHMQIDSILRPSHFDENVTACQQALDRGWTKPFRKGAHAKNPPKRRQDTGVGARQPEAAPPPLTDADRAAAQKLSDETRAKLPPRSVGTGSTSGPRGAVGGT